MTKKKKVYVVPHSHWDREWYFTVEDSNVLLTENMPYLIDVLENDEEFKSYTFDAQLSVVEEYLNLYPEDTERLKTLIEEKRIFVGPWYTQTDSLLVNKESIIRNLLYGTRIGNRFGHSMEVGYLPDIFGQNQYLPSIFKGFEIENAVLQRGLYNKQIKDNLNFKWQSPDGEEVKANNIFLGYGPGKFLASDSKYLNEKLIPMLEKLERMNKDSDYLLLPAGGDQVLVRTHFPKTVEELNRKQDKYEFILSNYEDFMKETWKTDFKDIVEGELIACEKSRIHNTIKSQRYDIKKANYDIENKILNVLEPLLVIGKEFGLRYPTPWLDQMWKELFDAHAHDSIGGCNSDSTNKDIINRLEKANRVALGLINIVKKQISNAISKNLEKENIFVLFNTDIKKREKYFDGVIFTKEPKLALEDIDGNKVDFTLIDREYLSGGKQVVVTAEGEKEIEIPGYYRNEIIIENLSLEAMGYKTLIVKEEEREEEVLSKKNRDYIENEMFKVSVIDGKLTLLNKEDNETIKSLVYFEDSEDCGDSYDYSPNADGRVDIYDKFDLVSCVETKNVSKMEIYCRALEAITLIELRQGEEIIRVKQCINNKKENHRVRAVINVNIESKTSISDQGFSIVERNNKNKYLENWKELGFVEAPVGIYALENFTYLNKEDKQRGVITKGIKEFEVLENSKIALTLFRSVGLLGKDNLLWRPARASGINNKVVYTEDAQMLQRMEFEYAIAMSKSTSQNKMFKLTNYYVDKYVSYHKQSLNLFEERLERFEIPLNKKVEKTAISLFNIENESIILSVCKEAYEKDGVIIRLFNPSEKKESFKLITDKKIVETNLYERELKKINGDVTINGKSYITLKLKA